MSHYPQEEIKPYNTEEKKAKQVEKMFDNIAPAYDKLNHLLSLGIDKGWRKKAIQHLQSLRPQHILDVATGTGDFAIQAYSALAPIELLGIDISEGMMEVGRKKVKELGWEGRILFSKEDATALSFPNDRFDAITVAFGIRNFEQLDLGLREMCRVLRSSGRLVILELTVPEKAPMKQLYSLYSRIFIPTIGKLLSKDKSAYTYLPQSIQAFPQGAVMATALKQAGFRSVEIKPLTFGVCTLYIATKA